MHRGYRDWAVVSTVATKCTDSSFLVMWIICHCPCSNECLALEIAHLHDVDPYPSSFRAHR